MRSRSKPLALALALVLASGLIACGGEEGDGTSSATSAPTTTSTTGQDQRGGEASIEDFGSEAAGSEREQILAVFSGYLGAIAERHHPSACSYLSTAVKASLRQLAAEPLRAKGCAAILPKLLAPSAPQIAREQANGQITKVRLEGEQAFVVFKAPGAELYQLTLVAEGGAWKAGSVAASVLVPEL